MTNHIIINSTIPRIRYISNGILATYNFPFAIFKNSDLKVYFGSEVQVSDTYTISGAGESEGGTVTLSNVPESGVIITLTRELPIERTSDFQEGGTLRADTLNHELDYQIACQQQIADNLNRSMILPPYAADSDVKLTLPMPSVGKAIVWNSEGTNLENSTVAINALESTLRGYKESAESASATATAKADNASGFADTASTQAGIATTQAGIATTQAGIATAKAEEATATLSSKANKDMNNLSNLGKSNTVTLGMPDYASGVSRTKDTTYTAEKNGWIYLMVYTANTTGTLTIDGITAAYWHTDSGQSEQVGFLTPVAKGSSYKYSGTASVSQAGRYVFYPCKGEV